MGAMSETPTAAEIRADLDAARIKEWRDERWAKLVAGLDEDALKDHIHIADMDDYLGDLVSLLFTKPEMRAIKEYEIKLRLINNALRVEEERGDWK